MRITKLSLTNFRSFKDTQTINFAPVTLLFGPNSAGKSTVLMALFYLQQILAKGQCNPQRLESLGDKFVGGFENLVHGRDLNKTIKIKVEYEKSLIGSTYDAASEAIPEILDHNSPDYVCILMSGIMTEVNKIAVEVEVAWSFSLNQAYVQSYKVWLDEEFISEITCDQGGRNPLITKINYIHPLIFNSSDDFWIESRLEDSGSLHEIHKEPLRSRRPDLVDEDFDEMFFSNGYASEFEFEFGSLPLAIQTQNGALPHLNRRLNLAFNSDIQLDNALANDIYSEIVVSPLDNLLSILNSSLCIGPLRKIPDVTYQPNPYPEQKDWYKGLAAWDHLALKNNNLLFSVHEWMSDQSKLDLGYGISLKAIQQYTEFKSVSSKQEFMAIQNQLNSMVSSSSHYIHEQLSQFDEASASYTYSLMDLKNNMTVTPADIGVGVSQLLPFVVATLVAKKGFIAIEQPELHVHPRVQVAIGDLLTQANDKASFLIETHSEHLILRLLRRIRETTDNELPEGTKPVTPKDISIVYIEPSDNGVQVRNIEIDEDGEFTSHWPKGFFGERREELF